MLDMIVKLYGHIDQETVDAALIAIEDVFLLLDFHGELPELHMSEGVILMNGHPMGALYQANPGEPGRIRISPSELMVHTHGDYQYEPVIVSAYIAHEAVEHVNYQRGIPLLFTGIPIAPEIHAQAESERMANRIAKEVTLKRYGVDFAFDDERYWEG